MTKTRQYNSPRRDRMAEGTRAKVLDAAKTLFGRQGIDRVKISEIGKKAGVATSTVYALFQSKDGILQSIMRETLFGDRFLSAQRVLEGVSDSAAQVALTAHVARAIYESESAELGLIRGISSFSPTLRKIETEFERMRYAMQEERIKALFAQSKARAGLDITKARRIMWMYTSRDIYRMLVSDGGWSADEYQAWLSDALLDALVSVEARGSALEGVERN